MALGGSSHLVLHILPSSCSARLLKVITLFHQSTIPPVSARPVRRQKCVTQAARHISNPLTDEHYVFAACYNTTSSPIERTVLASGFLLIKRHSSPALRRRSTHTTAFWPRRTFTNDLRFSSLLLRSEDIWTCYHTHIHKASVYISLYKRSHHSGLLCHFCYSGIFRSLQFFLPIVYFLSCSFFPSPPCHCQNVPVLSLDGWCAHPYYFFFVPPLIIF